MHVSFSKDILFAPSRTQYANLKKNLCILLIVVSTTKYIIKDYETCIKSKIYISNLLLGKETESKSEFKISPSISVTEDP